VPAEEDTLVSSPVRRYYDAIDEGDYAGVGRCFAPDAVLVRAEKVAPVESGRPKARQLVVSHGRAEIEHFVQIQAEQAAARGADIRHRITSVVTAGDRCFVEGAVPSPEGGADVVFFAHATVGADGLISRYVAVSNESPDGGLHV
jgi:ketosteroid isomerase-like protein